MSQSRVVCENALKSVKRYNAVSMIYRNRIENFDDRLMLTAASEREALYLAIIPCLHWYKS